MKDELDQLDHQLVFNLMSPHYGIELQSSTKYTDIQVTYMY